MLPQPPYSAFAAIYHEIMGDLPHTAWFDFIRQYLPPVSTKPFGDLFSGPGYMTTAAERAGYLAVSLDRHWPFLKAQPRGGICADAAALPFADKSFMGLAATNCSVNYLKDNDALVQHFLECHRVLDGAGVYVFDVCPEERTLWLTTRTFEAANGRVRFAHCYESPLKILTTTLTITGEAAAEEHHVQKIFSPQEITAAAEQAGFFVRATEPNYALAVAAEGHPIMTWVLVPNAYKSEAVQPKE